MMVDVVFSVTEAEPPLKNALEIDEKVFGPDHPSVAAILIALASLYESEHRYQDAEPLAKNALVMNVKALGKDSDVVAEVTRSLFDTARQYRESFDVTGSKKSFEWQQVEGEDPVMPCRGGCACGGSGRGGGPACGVRARGQRDARENQAGRGGESRGGDRGESPGAGEPGLGMSGRW